MRTVIAIIVVLALVAGGCGDDNSGEPQTTAAASTVQPTTSTSVTDPAKVVVCGQTIGAGFSEVLCEDMSFDVALPERCFGGSCGLIVDIHGYSASGKDAESHTGMQGLVG